jgi:hypothetical protein
MHPLPSPPAALTDDAPAPDTIDEEPDDSGDDSSSDDDDSSSDEDVNENDEDMNENDEEDEDVDIVGLKDETEGDNSIIANNGDNNNDNNDNNNGGDQVDDNRYCRAEYHMHTGIALDGHFCALLEGLLRELDHTMRPLYLTRHYVEPGVRDYYTTEVHVRVTTDQARRWRSRSLHYSTTPFSTKAATGPYRGQVHDMSFRFVPSCISKKLC